MSVTMPRMMLMACLLSLSSLAPSLSHALGLGEIHLNSALNEPMNAEIDLVAATPDELTALRATLGQPRVLHALRDRPSAVSLDAHLQGRQEQGWPGRAAGALDRRNSRAVRDLPGRGELGARPLDARVHRASRPARVYPGRECQHDGPGDRTEHGARGTGRRRAAGAQIAGAADRCLAPPESAAPQAAGARGVFRRAAARVGRRVKPRHRAGRQGRYADQDCPQLACRHAGAHRSNHDRAVSFEPRCLRRQHQCIAARRRAARPRRRPDRRPESKRGDERSTSADGRVAQRRRRRGGIERPFAFGDAEPPAARAAGSGNSSAANWRSPGAQGSRQGFGRAAGGIEASDRHPQLRAGRATAQARRARDPAAAGTDCRAAAARGGRASAEAGRTRRSAAAAAGRPQCGHSAGPAA